MEGRGPEWIPIVFDMFPAVKIRHGDALKDLLRAHPLVFEAHEIEAFDDWRSNPLVLAGTYTDCWGCGWHNACEGNLGYVVDHPLADWSALDTFRVPDPLEQEDWQQNRAMAEERRRAGQLVHGGTPIESGGFFDRLQFLRGLDNLLADFALDPPRLQTLIDIVLEYNLKAINKWMEIGVDVMHFHGDLATQRGPMMSPDTFRKYVKPAYEEMFQACRRNGAHVHYSCDGNLLDLVDDLVECGVTIHDPQVRANGIDAIAETYNGKLCAMVDIDEQMLPFCTPQDIDDQVREIIAKVGSPEGGLILFACPTEDVPLENIEAICVAWENYRLPGRCPPRSVATRGAP
ncbi:MAG: hypothetical protein HQ559_14990 [Lentisphaerae bacterium]|nr:hypothetical protein [Lentisphaerota bacterium]